MAIVHVSVKVPLEAIEIHIHSGTVTHLPNAFPTFSSIRRFTSTSVGGTSNFSPVIISYSLMYLCDSSTTSSSGAAGMVSSLYGSHLSQTKHLKSVEVPIRK